MMSRPVCGAVIAALSIPILSSGPAMAQNQPAATPQPPAAAQTGAAAQPAAGAPAGTTPTHIPPIMYGEVSTFTPNRSGFSLAVAASGQQPASQLAVTVPKYAEINRLNQISLSALKPGDSVLIQGRETAGTFNATRVFRTAKQAGLAPGVALLTATTGVAPTTPAGVSTPAAPGASPVVANPAAPTAGTTATPAPTTQAAKNARRYQKGIQNAIKRGELTGRLVSTNPMQVEVFDGEEYNVAAPANVMVLDQVRVKPEDIAAGEVVEVKGSETGPGAYRASEINLLPAALYQTPAATPPAPARRTKKANNSNSRRRPPNRTYRPRTVRRYPPRIYTPAQIQNALRRRYGIPVFRR